GADIITGGNSGGVVYGGPGNDTILGGNGADLLYGGTGDDSINAGNGADTVSGGPGINIVIGGNGPDLVLEDGDYDFAITNGSTIPALTPSGLDQVIDLAVNSDIESASLTGGASNNTFSVVGWSQPATIDGNDTTSNYNRVVAGGT